LTQKSLFNIDAYKVHGSKEFLGWMKGDHPNIIVDFVPGGCTSVGQPADVGIQRPFKLLAKRSFHEDIVNEFSEQLRKGKGDIVVDDRIGVLRDRSLEWVAKAFNVINKKAIIQSVSIMLF
jgi:DDE superfamily endonuclease